MRAARSMLAACLALAAAGCGQKGPLYLPDKNAAVVTSPAPADAPAPAPAGTPAPRKKSDQDEDPQAPK